MSKTIKDIDSYASSSEMIRCYDKRSGAWICKLDLEQQAIEWIKEDIKHIRQDYAIKTWNTLKNSEKVELRRWMDRFGLIVEDVIEDD